MSDGIITLVDRRIDIIEDALSPEELHRTDRVFETVVATEQVSEFRLKCGRFLGLEDIVRYTRILEGRESDDRDATKSDLCIYHKGYTLKIFNKDDKGIALPGVKIALGDFHIDRGGFLERAEDFILRTLEDESYDVMEKVFVVSTITAHVEEIEQLEEKIKSERTVILKTANLQGELTRRLVGLKDREILQKITANTRRLTQMMIKEQEENLKVFKLADKNAKQKGITQ